MNTTTRMSVYGLIAAATLGTSPALAQHASANASFVTQNPDATTERHVTINSNDNGTTYQITIDNDNLTATMNGKTLDPDRVDWKDGVVTIRDKDGHELQTFQVGDVGDEDTLAFEVAPDANAHFATTGSTHPPVMVGINQTDPTAALRWQLGLDKDTQAILVESVIDGLPADKAGLHRYDVIVGIDGSDGANSRILHDALMGKNPGDTLKLDVISRGERKTVAIDLAPYEASLLMTLSPNFVPAVPAAPAVPGVPNAPGAPNTLFRWSVPTAPDADQDWGQYGRELRERAMAELQDSLRNYQGHDREQVQREIEQALKEQQDALREHFDQARDQYQQALELRGNRLVLPRDLSGQAADAQTAVQDRLAKLEDRLNRLEDEIGTKMDRLVDRVERALDEVHNDKDDDD